MPAVASQPSPLVPRRVVEGLAFAFACAVTVGSAVLVKGGHKGPALMAIDAGRVVKAAPVEAPTESTDQAARQPRAITDAASITQPGTPTDRVAQPAVPHLGSSARWFNGRPIRPSHAMWMTVTAYTPGAESCWPSDDGLTATLHSVHTNAGCLVAADTSVLPFGSLISIDGYDSGSVVPVLDRGGKIRGHRLDVLMATVPDARAWGVRRIPVLVWEYSDGLGSTDPRLAR